MAEDMSDVISKLGSMMGENKISPDLISSISSMFQQNNSANASSENSEPKASSIHSENDRSHTQGSSTDFNFDIETILKMKNIMEKMNSKDDSRTALLLSLKPYLNDDRKTKLDQYIKFLNMSKLIELFNFGGDAAK